MLLDEIEGLRHDKDRFGNLIAVLNSRFERGGFVTRIEKRGDRFIDVSYPTYCPRVLAGIDRLVDTLEGRSITIYLERKLRSDKVERFSRARLWESMQPLRDGLYMWALAHAPDLYQIYEAVGHFDALEGLGDRERDLWEPLVSIALLCDSEENIDGRPLTDEMCSLARDLSEVRKETDAASVIQILNALERVVGSEEEFRITPTDLLSYLKRDPHFEWLKSTKALAGLLAPLGIISKSHRHPETGKVARLYKLRATLIKEHRDRYG